MIPNNLIVAEVESTMQGEHHSMGVREEDMPHLMGILSEIYTNPTEAVAREYLTNALDSHVEAGQTRPVEVGTPSVWQPNLTIKDFGVGMDADDIRNVYKFYGASTKRDSNSVTGMLGIGSKSAFAYSNSFTVVGIKNGVKTVVALNRTDEGTAGFDIVDVSPTDEGNGVTVTVPVTDASAMTAAVNRVASYLPEGKALVDGRDLSVRKEWSLIASDIKDETGKIIIHNLWRSDENRGYHNPSRIIMGNVAYEPISEISPEGWNSHVIYAEVAMGSVVFAPSREKLMDTALTRRTEKFVLDSGNNLLADSIIEEIEGAKSNWEAMCIHGRHKDTLARVGRSGVTYNGNAIKHIRDFAASSANYSEIVCRTYQPFAWGPKASNENYIKYVELMNASAVFVNAPDKRFTTSQRRKMEQWAENRGMSGSGCRLVAFPKKISDKFEDDPWLDGLETIDWSVIEAEIIPRRQSTSSGGGVKTKGKYHALEVSSDGSLVRNLREIKDDEDIFYFNLRGAANDWDFHALGISHGGSQSDREDSLGRTVVETLPDNATVLTIYANRIDKFVRDYPNAVELTFDLLNAKMVDKIVSQVTDEQLKGSAAVDQFGYFGANGYQFIPDDDPDIEWFKISESHVAQGIFLTSLPSQICARLGEDHEISKKFEDLKDSARAARENLRNRYPSSEISIPYYVGAETRDSLRKRYIEADYAAYLQTQEKE